MIRKIKLDKLMQIRGVKVQELAKAVRISPGHASNLKTGRRKACLDLALKIAKYLRYPVDAIIFGYF